MRKRYYLWSFFVLALFYTLNLLLIQHRQHQPPLQAEKLKEETSYEEVLNEIEVSVNPGQLKPYYRSQEDVEKPVARSLLQTPEEPPTTTSFDTKLKKMERNQTIVYQQQNPGSRPRKPEGKVSNVLNFTKGACGRYFNSFNFVTNKESTVFLTCFGKRGKTMNQRASTTLQSGSVII